ncbi:MAG: hypothetical protein NZ483_05420 [Verrucomicrobiae bacterium]|nr:hypothetical protein [Verrucomicrobiae bacterium]MDW8342966.1 hypothetical protein [Verrucomicrobiae bacterium]
MKPSSNPKAMHSWIAVGVLAIAACAFYLGYVVLATMHEAQVQPSEPVATAADDHDTAVFHAEPPPLPPPSASTPVDAQRSSVGVITNTTTPPITEDIRELARAQAAYLRELNARNTDPDGINKLSEEEIAEMERKGILAW